MSTFHFPFDGRDSGRGGGAREDLSRYLRSLDEGEAARNLADWAGDAQIVMIGEASHGTQEFYEFRAEITRHLIEEHQFSAVAVEADWPDAYQVNRYVRDGDGSGSAEEALRGFERFPQWMWRNRIVEDFVTWLHDRNASQTREIERTSFYGLDLYSLHRSMQAVIEYLDRVDPEAANEAKKSYGCFETFEHDTENYAWAARRLGEGLCEDVVLKELLTLRAKEDEYLKADGLRAADEFFYAEQNARLARNAERYYRTMFRGRVASWNVRDRHMAETLDELMSHLRGRGQPARIVVWAHNSHLGDARATELGDGGELNVGQLVRERYGSNAKSIGFTTHSGSVTAASDWDGPAERKLVRPGISGSYEDFFHGQSMPRFFLPLRGVGAPPAGLIPERALERAIGVIYRPETERWSHYFQARLAEQFDGVVHWDETSAIEPLERTAGWEAGEVPETFPSGV